MSDKPPRVDPLTRPCPECGALAGQQCWDLRMIPGVRHKVYAHPQRQAKR